MNRALVAATFICDQCDEVTAQLILSSDQVLHQEGFWGTSREIIAPSRYAALAQALAQTDAAALYKLNFLWVPFYCPTCQRSYCYAHWQMEKQWDENFPGWYDCTYGTCPRGHRRLIDD